MTIQELQVMTEMLGFVTLGNADSYLGDIANYLDGTSAQEHYRSNFMEHRLSLSFYQAIISHLEELLAAIL